MHIFKNKELREKYLLAKENKELCIFNTGILYGSEERTILGIQDRMEILMDNLIEEDKKQFSQVAQIVFDVKYSKNEELNNFMQFLSESVKSHNNDVDCSNIADYSVKDVTNLY